MSQILVHKESVTRFLISFLLTITMCHLLKIDNNVFSLIAIVIWLLVLLNIDLKLNTTFYDSVVEISFGNMCAFFVMFLINNHSPGIIEFLFILVQGGITLYALIHTNKKLIAPDNSESNLYNERIEDLNRIRDYIDEFQIIGICSKWGNGKTFIFDKWKQENKDKYEIIYIESLTCNLDEIQLFLINEIEKLMYKNRLLPINSSYLKNALKDDKLFKSIISFIMPDSATYTKSYDKFKAEMKKYSGKKIMVVYDDLDRVNNSEVIKKVFAINEKLVTNTDIKVVYLYDEEKLVMKGIDYEYLEKYIPYRTNLTNITYKKLLSQVLNENDDENISYRDFSSPFGNLKMSFSVIMELLKKNSYRSNFDFNTLPANPRKIKFILDELTVLLSSNSKLNCYKKELSIILFYKYVFPMEFYKLQKM